VGSGLSVRLRSLLKSWTETAVWTQESSLYRNQSWYNNPDLFGVKITRHLAAAFLKHLTISVSLPDFLNCGCNRNHDIGNPFPQFQRFYSLTALLKKFSWFYDQFLFPYTFFTNDIFPADLLQPW
jgi:hypothetical protein